MKKEKRVKRVKLRTASQVRGFRVRGRETLTSVTVVFITFIYTLGKDAPILTLCSHPNVCDPPSSRHRQHPSVFRPLI